MDTVNLPAVIPATRDGAPPGETQLSLFAEYTVSSASLVDVHWHVEREELTLKMLHGGKIGVMLSDEARSTELSSTSVHVQNKGLF